MRQELALRAVDDADRAFLARLAQRIDQFPPIGPPPIGQRAGITGLAKGIFPAVRARREDSLDLHLAVPIISRRNGAPLGAETDQHRLLAIGSAAKLADVELTL